MMLFIKFINDISNSVRIDTIIEKIFQTTKASMLKFGKFCHQGNGGSPEEWITCSANHSGYFQVIRIRPLLKLLRKKDVKLAVIPLRGQFYTARSPLFRISSQIDDESLDEIRAHFLVYSEEVIFENFMFGFRQLSEVAVKALSPGINDAGVARLCIDHFGELLRLYLQEENKCWIVDKSGKERIIIHQYSFLEILDCSITPIKPYSAKDYTIIICIMKAFENVSLYDDSRSKQSMLNRHVVSLLQDAKEKIRNFIERERINEVSCGLNSGGYFRLPMLEITDEHSGLSGS